MASLQLIIWPNQFNILLSIYPKEVKAGTCTYICTPCSQQHSQKSKGGNNPSVYSQIDIVVYKYKGILLSLKKEENSDICYNMASTWGHYTKPITNRQIFWLHLHVVPKLIKFIKTESKMAVAKGLVLNGYRVLVG